MSLAKLQFRLPIATNLRRCLMVSPNEPNPQSPPNSTESDPETDFGYSRVPSSQKTSMVKEVFNRVATKYDIMNDIMSLGIHRLWKTYFVNQLALSSLGATPVHILDMAGGTGDIAFRCIDALRAPPTFPSVFPSPRHAITIADINQSMLDIGMERARTLGYGSDSRVLVDFVCADAQNLVTIPDSSIDLYTIAFGLRNVTKKESALAEAYRVLKPGGRFLCMEFSSVHVPGLRKLYDIWSHHGIPRLGGLIAGDTASYQYLVESIRQFPDQDTLAQMIREAAFSEVSHENLSGGIVAIHSGFKIPVG